MRKLILMIVLGGLMVSCVSNGKKTYSNTEPTTEEILQVFDKQRNEGVEYYRYKDGFVTESELDSISDLVHDQAIKELMEEYDSISSQ